MILIVDIDIFRPIYRCGNNWNTSYKFNLKVRFLEMQRRKKL